jgi:uncharacterized protein (TIGR04255 family)
MGKARGGGRRGGKLRSASPGHLNNAPIVEALVDLRVSPADGLSLEQLARVHGAVASDYPIRKTRHLARGKLDLSDVTTPMASAESRVDGYRLESEDGLRVFQTQLEGFTFSWLRPYRNWTALRAEAQRLWDVYVSELAPTSVKRIALRYINRIPLPASGKLDDWFVTRPELGNGMPFVSDLFMRLVLPIPDVNGFAIITQATDGSDESPSSFPIILDIDIFREGSFAPVGTDLWEILDRFREEKNRLFFGSITDETRRLFE